MPTAHQPVELSEDDLRAVTAFAVACAERVLSIFEAAVPDDARPRDAVEAARAFSLGAKRTTALRQHGFAALKAAGAATDPAAIQAARAASHAAGAAFLHPLADANQVKHILGAAANAAVAEELRAGADATAGSTLDWARGHASPDVVTVLRRFPPAPDGGGRAGVLVRALDAALRRS